MIEMQLQLFGGRGSKSGGGSKALADVFSSKTPSEESIKSGSATYGGIRIVYNPNMENEASNYTTRIEVGDKFFQSSASAQREILSHEVSHNYSDEMIERYAADSKFMDAFVIRRPVPKGSVAYQRGQREYMVGLYGDIGATALVESTTLAIQEYITNRQGLRQRSQKAYRYIDKFFKGRRLQ